MITGVASAINDIAEVVMFENWLRFYFIAEEDDKLVLRLPEKAMEQIKRRYAKFYDLADYLNNLEIDHSTSLKAVCMFVSGGSKDARLADDEIAKIFDNPAFHLELQIFSSWVQAHEEQLDRRFMEFSEWQKEYAAWKESEEVQDYISKLRQKMPLHGSNATETLQ